MKNLSQDENKKYLRKSIRSRYLLGTGIIATLALSGTFIQISSLIILTAILLTLILKIFFIFKPMEEKIINMFNDLEKNQKFLRKIADGMPGLIAYWDKDLICKFSNVAYQEWFGKSLSEMDGINLKDLLGSELFEKNRKYIEGVISGKKQQFERQLTKADGSIGYTWAQYIPDTDEKENILGFFILVSDITKLRETERLLNNRLETALDVAGIGAWTLNNDTKQDWHSKNTTKIYGFSEDSEWKSSDIIAKVIPEDKERTIENFAAIKTQKNFAFDFRIESSDLKQRWLSLRGGTSFNQDKKFISSIGIIEDISKFKILQQQLEEANRWMATIFDSAKFSIIATNTDGTILLFNKGAEAMLGYTAHEVINKTTPAIIHDKDEVIAKAKILSDELGLEINPGFDVFVTKARISNSADENEWTYITKDGKRIPVLLSVTAVRSNKGDISGYLGIAQDITVLKQATENNNLYKQALDESAIVAFTDHKGVISYVNQKFCHISGYTSDELLGNTHSLLNSGFHPKDFFKDMWKTIAQGKIWRDDICNRTKDGSIYWVDSTIVPERNKFGKIVRYIAIRFDVTQKKRMEALLIKSRETERIAKVAANEAAQTKARFLANMSHEIRTPMNGVIGMTDLLLDTNLTSEQKKYVDTIHDCGISLLTIIDDILDFSKIESKKIELEKVPYDIQKLIEAKVDILAHRAYAKEIEISAFVEPKVPRILIGDPNRIGQIVLNLLSNAVKFTNTGSVYCKATVENNITPFLKIEVIDSGIGLTKEQTQKLFSPFSQADSSTSRMFGGTGLGLSICKMLVELMEGDISVTSEPGKGSNFHFKIPLSFQTEQTQTIAANLPEEVIVATSSDADTIRILLTESYRSWGCKVHECDLDIDAIKENIRNINKDFEKKILVIINHDETIFDNIFESLQNLNLRTIVISRYGDSSIPETNSYSLVKKPIHQSSLLNATMRLWGHKVEQKLLPDISSTIRCHNILIAEDNPVNQTLLSKLLENLGQSVTIVKNGKEAVQEVKESDFSIVFMDCQMPEMDGFEATKTIRLEEKGTGKHVLIVALTANAMEGDRELCINAGMDDYLAKPVKKKSLQSILLKWLEKK